MAKELTGWTDCVRSDGVQVARGVEGWVVIPERGLRIDLCPCCHKPMLTERAAKLVAEGLFPLPQQHGEGEGS